MVYVCMAALTPFGLETTYGFHRQTWWLTPAEAARNKSKIIIGTHKIKKYTNTSKDCIKYTGISKFLTNLIQIFMVIKCIDAL